MSLPKNVWRWSFYDFANSSYVLIFQAFLLPAFFSTVLFTKGYSLSAWGIANGISTAIGILLAIILGKYADKHSRLKIFKWVILTCFAGMATLSLFVGIFASGVFYLFIFTNCLFIASLSLSDSILPYVSNKNNSYEYSGFAWGFGYLGGIASLVIAVILQKLFSEYSPIVFLSVAIFYLCFSLYALNGLKDTPLNDPKDKNKKDIISKKQKIFLLIGYWLISESITVIILFFSIFAAKELGFSTFKIGISLLFVQLIGFPATWLGGKLTKRFNNVSLLGLSILLWGIVIALMITNPSLVTFAFVVFFTGLTIGNSQSFLRAQYSTVINKSESGYQFGIYAFISQAAASIGPIIYGLASDSLGSQKVPMLFLFALMVIGFVIIWKIMNKVKPKIEMI
ncbi:MAG: MFS transporter [Candidatus Magasanikbacteria bacterium]